MLALLDSLSDPIGGIRTIRCLSAVVASAKAGNPWFLQNRQLPA
jgi:hypothetical protein